MQSLLWERPIMSGNFADRNPLNRSVIQIDCDFLVKS
jgi:hypothetical protein